MCAPLTSAEAVRIAREIYGLEAAAQPLPGEYDDNFRLRAADSREFALKIMHPAREDSFVDMQCRALMHLAERVPHITLPRVVGSPKGKLFSRIEIADGSRRLVWMLTFIPCRTLVETKPHSAELLTSLGRLLGEIDAALFNFSHPATERELKWDVARSLWAREYLSQVRDPRRRSLAAHFLNVFESVAVPLFPRLRHSVIYGDANDHNVLVSPPWPQPQRALSVIDFGDIHVGFTVGEVAVGAAYAVLGEQNPLAAAAAVLSAYHQVLPLNEHEIAAFYPFLCSRLAVSVINSAYRQTLIGDDPYVTVSETPAWESLERLAQIHPRLAHYTFRGACDLPPVSDAVNVGQWLAQNTAESVVPVNLRERDCLILDLSVGSTFLGADPAQAAESRMTRNIRDAISAAKAPAAIGRYNEPRAVYTSPQYATTKNPTDERRTIHLGIDVFMDPGTPVSTPFDGIVHAFADNSSPQDYGAVVILKHDPGDGLKFFTLYGHLSRESLATLHIGQRFNKGQPFASIGTVAENGGWTPHLHFQIIVDLLDLSTDFPGVAFASQRDVFLGLSPDPNLILGIPERCFTANEFSVDHTLAARQSVLGRNLSVSYAHPLKIVRGCRQYLYDETGRAYLDVYNNVPLVGHSHPRVVLAVQQQIALLNTNTRYLHDNIVRYAERLTALLPAPLKVCYFLNSGSEANELALRLARAHTKRADVIVLEHAYHGHTSTLIDISPYKFNGPGGSGRKPWVHVAPIPDSYRGLYRGGESDLGLKYAAEIEKILDRLKQERRCVAAFIAETLPSVAGQIVFPPQYLAEAYKHIRAAGGVCIADEVQVGFGRLGTHFWGFETQGVVPDIVVLGKPIGNAFPLAAVVTTPEIAASFDNGMEFFSTFGGNPVACAAGLAVLDVLRDDQLQHNALSVGSTWIQELRALRARFPLLGDVRGSGLFLGLDLVNQRETREPATDRANYVVNRLRDRGILAGTDGPHHNVIKLRPPLIFSNRDAALFNSTLVDILSEDPAQTN